MYSLFLHILLSGDVVKAALVDLRILFLVHGEYVGRVLDHFLEHVAILLWNLSNILWHQGHHVVVACPQVGRQNVLIVNMQLLESLVRKFFVLL